MTPHERRHLERIIAPSTNILLSFHNVGPVITSYSIHYTKLYEKGSGIVRMRRAGGDKGVVLLITLMILVMIVTLVWEVFRRNNFV